MKAIFLVRDLPNGTTSGYKKRNFYFLKELERLNIDVVLVREDEICRHTNKNKSLLIAIFSLFSILPFSIISRYVPTIKERIKKYITEDTIDMLICDSIYRSLNIPLDFKGRKILFEHNIESGIFKRYAESEKNILKKIFVYIEYLKMRTFQKKIWKKFDTCIVCSELDKKILTVEAAHKNVVVVNNGVDTSYFTSDATHYAPCTMHQSILYTGQISWFPNEDAVLHFVKGIFPIIKAKNPQVKFYIVGDKPSERVRKLAHSDRSIVVTGFVEDVREYMREASVFVVPLRIGGGTRLKILEALSMGKAVVSTSIGCEGLDLEDKKHIIIKDEPAEFAAAVSELLHDEGLRISLGNNGRRLVERSYDWDVVFRDCFGPSGLAMTKRGMASQ